MNNADWKRKAKKKVGSLAPHQYPTPTRAYIYLYICSVVQSFNEMRIFRNNNNNKNKNKYNNNNNNIFVIIEVIILFSL